MKPRSLLIHVLLFAAATAALAGCSPKSVRFAAHPPVALSAEALARAAAHPAPLSPSTEAALQTPNWQVQRGLVPLANATERERQLARAVALVVHIDDSTGTGFFISPDGLFLTNAHVIPATGCTSSRCTGVRLVRDFSSGGEKEIYSNIRLLAYSAPLVMDPQAPVPGGSDFALFQVTLPEGATVPFLPLDLSDPSEITNLNTLPVRAIGHPLSAPAHSVRLQINAVRLVESAMVADAGVQAFFMTSLILPGSSGSPIVNLETGSAMGIVHSIAGGGIDASDLDAQGHARGHASFGSTARQIALHLEDSLPGATAALALPNPAAALGRLGDAVTMAERFSRPGLPYPWQIWAQPYEQRDELLSLSSLDENKHFRATPINTTALSELEYFHHFAYGAFLNSDTTSAERIRLGQLDVLISDRRNPENRVEFAEGLVRLAAYSGHQTTLPTEAIRGLVEKLISDAHERGPALAYALAKMTGIPVQGGDGRPLDCVATVTAAAPLPIVGAAQVLEYCLESRLADGTSVLEFIETELNRIRGLAPELNPEATNPMNIVLSQGEIGPMTWAAAHVAAKRGAALWLSTEAETAQRLRVLQLLHDGAVNLGLKSVSERSLLDLAETRISFRPFYGTYGILSPEERSDPRTGTELEAYLTLRRIADQHCDNLDDLDAHPECLSFSDL